MMVRKELKKEFAKLNEVLLKGIITQDSLIINESKEEVIACFLHIQEFIQFNLFNKESSNQGLIATIQLNLLESSNILLKHNQLVFSDYETNPLLLAFIEQNQLLINFLEI